MFRARTLFSRHREQGLRPCQLNCMLRRSSGPKGHPPSGTGLLGGCRFRSQAGVVGDSQLSLSRLNHRSP
jgi:hypothetical protein